MIQSLKFTPLALTLGLCFAARVGAQQEVVIRQATPRHTLKAVRHKDVVQELMQASIAPVEVTLHEVPFYGNGPKPKFDGLIYDNTPNTTGLFYFAKATGFPTFNLMDDVDLYAGATDTTTPTPASITAVTFALENYATTLQNVYGRFTIYDALVFTGTNVASTPLGAYTFQLTGTNRPTAGGHAYTFTLPAALSLAHDIGNGSSPYGFQLEFYSNTTRTAGHNFVTALFNGDGVTLGNSYDVFWDDTSGNKMFDPNTEGFFAGGGVGNYCNFYLSLTGTTVNDPTYEVSGVVSFPDLVATADVQGVTWTLHPVDGLTSDIVIHGTVDPDPNGGAGTYTLIGIPPNIYNLNIKGDKFLAKNVIDTTTTLPLVIDVTTSNYLGSADASLQGGDASNDNAVDIVDFGAIIATYGDTYTVGDPLANPADIAADFNGDGTIDIVDFGILGNNYGTTGDQLP